MPTVQFLDDQLEGRFIDSPSHATAGDVLTYTCQYWADVTASGAVATVYRSAYGTGNGKDVTANVMPSGSVSYGARSVILKPLGTSGTLTGNASYKIVVLATVNGKPEIRMFILPVSKAEAF